MYLTLFNSNTKTLTRKTHLEHYALTEVRHGRHYKVYFCSQNILEKGSCASMDVCVRRNGGMYLYVYVTYAYV